MDESDDVLRLSFIHRDPRILVFERYAEKLVQTGVGRHGDYVDPRRHDLAGVDFLQPQQLLDRVLLEWFQMAFAAAGFENELELLGRMSPAAVPA